MKFPFSRGDKQQPFKQAVALSEVKGTNIKKMQPSASLAHLFSVDSPVMETLRSIPCLLPLYPLFGSFADTNLHDARMIEVNKWRIKRIFNRVIASLTFEERELYMPFLVVLEKQVLDRSPNNFHGRKLKALTTESRQIIVGEKGKEKSY